ncbi:MAG: hypothetical protein ACLS7Z_06735 [Christensenellales bacterium]
MQNPFTGREQNGDQPLPKGRVYWWLALAFPIEAALDFALRGRRSRFGSADACGRLD